MMAQSSLQSTNQSAVQTTTGKPSRLFFLDHLRAALMIIVVLHHVAMVYGASAPFYYVEPPFTDPDAFRALLVFALINQGWFMGAFFLLSGYFTPGSFDRKGSGSFVKERLLRLGIPLIVYIFVLNPIAELGVYLMPESLTGITDSPTLQDYPDLIGLGPLWFVAMLLIFSFGYAAWRMLTRNWSPPSMKMPSRFSYLVIGIFILVLALVSFLFRMIVPLGESVNLFVDYLSFPTIAYLPQYLSFFVLGIVAFRHDWFRTLPNHIGIAGFITALVAVVVLFPLAFSGQWFSLELTPVLENSMGDGNWQSAVYALWDAAFAVGLCLGLIVFFRHFFNTKQRVGTFLSQQGYTVYIIHIPIIVFLAYAIRDVDLESLPKFGIAAVIIIPTCFIIAYIIRKLPFASRVL
jgi:glucans biosynthesis protein C